MFKIWYLKLVLNYPIHFTPKLGLMLQNQYCFSKRDIIGNASTNNEDFCYGAGKWTHPYLVILGSFGTLVSFKKYLFQGTVRYQTEAINIFF